MRRLWILNNEWWWCGMMMSDERKTRDAWWRLFIEITARLCCMVDMRRLKKKGVKQRVRIEWAGLNALQWHTTVALPEASIDDWHQFSGSQIDFTFDLLLCNQIDWFWVECRLFYAGACEGQMPEILTMIQVSRLTPTPAILVIAMLSLFYLSSDNIFDLINYVGFATWVIQQFEWFHIEFDDGFWTVEYRSVRAVCSSAAFYAARSGATH